MSNTKKEFSSSYSTLGAARSMVFLYGPPGVGKSTVGRLLAEVLNLPFRDLDTEIESRVGRTIPEIFEKEQEHGFRELEKAALSDLLAQGSGVVALGGGALLDADSRAEVEKAGPVVILNAPVETLSSRLRAAGVRRPLLSGQSLEPENASTSGLEARLADLLGRRAAHYTSFPFMIETAGLSPEEVTWQAQIGLGAFHVTGMGSGYDVRVHSKGLTDLGEALQQRGLRGPIALVCDENTSGLYAAQVMESLQSCGYPVGIVTIPAGEAHKTMQTISQLWDAFLSIGLERGSTVVALGGGVVGDLAGFAAATFLRGVRWVVLPTTLLSMVDASLGGKTGADLPQGKNLIGAFHPPSLVLSDPATLLTLPESELRSGMAEVVKHGLIGDQILFERCALDWDAIWASWETIVRRAMAVKVAVIQADPFEQGKRAALNLGHTVGHAVELVSGFHLKHGEAVAIGTVVEARLAERLGLAEGGLEAKIVEIFRGLGLPTEIPGSLDRMAILNAMGVDKKRANGKVRFALAVRVGEVKVGVEIEDIGRLLEF